MSKAWIRQSQALERWGLAPAARQHLPAVAIDRLQVEIVEREQALVYATLVAADATLHRAAARRWPQHIFFHVLAEPRAWGEERREGRAPRIAEAPAALAFQGLGHLVSQTWERPHCRLRFLFLFFQVFSLAHMPNSS